MATLRETRDRIRSVNSTKKITKAQELIATSQITKARQRVEAAQPYATELANVVGRVASATSLEHPLLTEKAEPKVAAIMVLTSDRGQCGGFNSNVLKTAGELEQRLKDEGFEIVRFVTGKKGIDYYNFREIPIAGQWTGFSERPEWEVTHNPRHHLIRGYVAGSEGEAKWRPGLNVPDEQPVRGFDQVHVVYTEFVSMLSQKARAQQLLPVQTVVQEEEFDYYPDEQAAAVAQGVEIEPDLTFEPDAETLLEAIMPQYVARVVYSMMLESAASESAARRTAMKNATDNANEIVKDLTRVANQARQAQITNEITEIIGGADALAESGESD